MNKTLNDKRAAKQEAIAFAKIPVAISVVLTLLGNIYIDYISVNSSDAHTTRMTINNILPWTLSIVSILACTCFGYYLGARKITQINNQSPFILN